MTTGIHKKEDVISIKTGLILLNGLNTTEMSGQLTHTLLQIVASLKNRVFFLIYLCLGQIHRGIYTHMHGLFCKHAVNINVFSIAELQQLLTS